MNTRRELLLVSAVFLAAVCGCNALSSPDAAPSGVDAGTGTKMDRGIEYRAVPDIAESHDVARMDRGIEYRAAPDIAESHDVAPQCSAPLLYDPGTQTCVSTAGLHTQRCQLDIDCAEGQSCAVLSRPMGGTCEITCGPPPQRLCPQGYTCKDVTAAPPNVCWSSSAPG
jgi:hypothetical protein